MGAMLAGPSRRRSSVPGTTLELLVLSPGIDGCIGVDMQSGALVRAAYPPSLIEDPPTFMPGLFDILAASIADPEDDLEPTLPESVELAELPRPIGRLSRRKADRLLRPLVHPPREPLLGIPGPAVAFWELRGNRPTVAVVEPEQPPAVVRRPQGNRCRFLWRGMGQDLPLVAPPASPARRLLVALTPPVQGRCYKVVAGFLP
jgi:hypothetical protein